MTPQEKEMLQGLTDRVNQTQLTEKDPEAEQFLFQSLGRNSDSLYILAQTVLVQKYALDQATQQLNQAKQDLETLRQQSQQQAAQPKHSGSFLGNLLGMNDSPAPPPPPPPPPPNQQYNSQPQYAPVPNYPPQQPQYGQPQYSQPQYSQPQYGQPGYGAPQSGGFLRSAMTTATGVAAGALAFEGIESLMHGFGHSGGESFGGGYGNQGRPEEIINNNYYGDSGDTLGSRADKAGLSSDLEDRRDFAGSGDNPAPDDVTDQDTANFDDSSDDSSDFSSDDNSDFSGGDNS